MENPLTKYGLEFLRGIFRTGSFAQYDDGQWYYHFCLRYLNKIISGQEAFNIFLKLGVVPEGTSFDREVLLEKYELNILPDEKGGCSAQCLVGSDSLASFCYGNSNSSIRGAKIFSSIRELYIGWYWFIKEDGRQSFVAAYFLKEITKNFLNSPGALDNAQIFFSDIQHAELRIGGKKIEFPLEFKKLQIQKDGLFVYFSERR